DSITRDRARALLGYGAPEGFAPLREALADYLRRARAIQDREIVITNGSQEALYIAIQLLVQPGDAVGIEALGYHPARETLRAAGAKLIAIPMLEDGIDLDALERIVRRHRLRLLYLTPLHQFPTTKTLSASARARLYALAVRHGIPILEDDYDHEYHYRCL